MPKTKLFKEEEKRIGAGRPRKTLDQQEIELIEILKGAGCSAAQISKYVGISVPTLYRNFEKPLKEGEAKLHCKLRYAQVQAALKGNPTLLIWLGKQYLNQSDSFKVTDDDGNPGFQFVQPTPNKDTDK